MNTTVIPDGDIRRIFYDTIDKNIIHYAATLIFGKKTKEIPTPVTEWWEDGIKEQGNQRMNYLTRVAEHRRWTPAPTSNNVLVAADKRNALTMMRDNALMNFFNGVLMRADEILSMAGVFQLSVNGGCGYYRGVPVWSLQSVFEQLAMSAFAIYHKVEERPESGVRYVFARHAMLHPLFDIYKDVMGRHRWSFEDIELDCNSLELGGITYVFMPMDFTDPEWKDRIICLDLDNIELCAMNGIPFFAEYSTDNSYGCEMNFTARVPFPKSNFIIDLRNSGQ